MAKINIIPKNIRNFIINKYKKCLFCGVESNLHVHHNNRNSYDNSINNLLLVCKKCHTEIHSFGIFLELDGDKWIIKRDDLIRLFFGFYNEHTGECKWIERNIELLKKFIDRGDFVVTKLSNYESQRLDGGWLKEHKDEKRI